MNYHENSRSWILKTVCLTRFKNCTAEIHSLLNIVVEFVMSGLFCEMLELKIVHVINSYFVRKVNWEIFYTIGKS